MKHLWIPILGIAVNALAWLITDRVFFGFMCISFAAWLWVVQSEKG